MYVLMTVDKATLDMEETFHETKKEAIEAMVNKMIELTDYNSLDEIIKSADAELCGFSDKSAWAKSKDGKMLLWKIMKF